MIQLIWGFALVIGTSLIVSGCSSVTVTGRNLYSSLPGLEDAFASRGISSAERDQDSQERVAAAIDRRDLIRGMSMEEVKASWGSPSEIEVAGHASLGNQRWRYLEGLGLDRDTTKSRLIYFESGRVMGWECRQCESVSYRR
jgi:hypothetical protein